MKIGVKLVAVISAFNVVGIALLAGVTVSLSQKEISRLAEEEAKSLAVQGGKDIQTWFGVYIETSRALAHVMEGYKDIPPAQRRWYFNLMLRQTRAAHPEVTAVYANWAPQALDGMDEVYAGTHGTDATGRYAPGWSAKPNGIDMEPIRTFPFDAVTRVTNGEEFVFEPTVLLIGGNSVLAANMCVPVKDAGVMVGITGISFEISRIQAITEGIKPFGDGYAMVFSAGGLVAAHPDTERLGKDMRESEKDTFGGALEAAVGAVTAGKAAAFSAPSANGIMQYYAVPFTIGRYP
ncbi:MAG: hypothetical protein LBQ30_09955, partial [Treponema sp.]|nr:hypothetical protein [Treponema sp.]